jgi:CheY-like chemotaxis protein
VTTLLDEDLLTPADAAELLQLSGDMVRLIARTGRLPTAARSVRGARLFRRADVELLAAERAGRVTCNHAVQFYDNVAHLAQSVTHFVGGALALDAPCVIVATPLHRSVIAEALAQQGQDVRELHHDDRLVMLDARQMLCEFMNGSTPDPVRFRQTLGALIERHAAAHPKARVHVFADMVDLLWRDGQAGAALEVEELWNGLARELPFTLLCGYAMTDFTRGKQADVFARVCTAHTRVAPTERYERCKSRDARLREIVTLQREAGALQHESAAREGLQGEVVRLREALLASERARDGLLRRLEHELRNPLGPIITALELAALEKDPGRQRAIITRQVKQLVKTVDVLLTEKVEAPMFDRGPLAAPAIEEGEAPPRRAVQSGFKVMVVDDNIDAAESLSEVLEELGYSARSAHDANGALELADNFRPHVALLDIGLPGMSGLELARQLRGRGDTAAMRLVAVTGYSRKLDREQSEAAGCEAHLVKPVDLHELEGTLKVLLGERMLP